MLPFPDFTAGQEVCACYLGLHQPLGIIAEFQKYLKKLKALKILYEFDEMRFDTDQILPGPQGQVCTDSAHSY